MSPTSPERLVLGAIPDLMLATRIAATAAAGGIAFANVAPATLVDETRTRRPSLVLLDLAAIVEPMPLIVALRAEPELASCPVLGFYPHVRDELRVAALAAGATHVLPRSAFTSRLADVLAGSFPAAR